MGTQGHEAEVWEEIAARGEDIGHGVVEHLHGHIVNGAWVPC